MKQIIVLTFSLVTLLARAQNDTTKFDDSCHLSKFSDDLTTIYDFINELDTMALKPLYVFFKEYHGPSPGSSGVFRKKAGKYLVLVDNFDSLLTHSDFYLGRTGCPCKGRDSSYLYYYTNKEIADYRISIKSLKEEIMPFIKGASPDLFDNSAFEATYTYMCTSRDMLMNALDNLQHYYQTRGIDEAIRKMTDQLPDKFAAATQRLNALESELIATNNQLKAEMALVHGLDTLLRQPVMPYFNASKLFIQRAGYPDKVQSSANAALYDSRKNGWWRAAIGGIIAGVISGLLVHTMK